jgi:predicted DNA binding CopG/RHH family protein
MANKLKIPRFESEADEARWWSNHRDELPKAFEDAATRGELATGSAARLARERAVGTTPTTTIRLDPVDISRAHTLAAKRGLRYQTYLKILIHEALEAEERNSRQVKRSER